MAHLIIDGKPIIAIQPAQHGLNTAANRCQSCGGELVHVGDRDISHSAIRPIRQKILACVDCKVTYTDIS